MMAESFSLIYVNKVEFFLFLRAKHGWTWLARDAVPPPFSVLSLPYHLLHRVYLQVSKVRQARLGGGLAAVLSRDKTGSLPFKLPESWVEDYPHKELTTLIVES
jgi:hypothetical protein